MKAFSALWLSAALFIAGCAGSAGSTAPELIPLVSAEPSPVSSLVTAAEVMVSACEGVAAAFVQLVGSESKWSQRRLSDKEFYQDLNLPISQLIVAGQALRDSGFSFPKMPNGPSIFGLHGNNLFKAYGALFEVTTSGIGGYQSVKRHLSEAKNDLTDWFAFYCEPSG